MVNFRLLSRSSPCLPFGPSRNLSKGPRRAFLTLGRAPIKQLREQADQHPQDWDKQCQLLNAQLRQRDYPSVIKRCEDLALHRMDPACAELYLAALYETGQLQKAGQLLLHSRHDDQRGGSSSSSDRLGANDGENIVKDVELKSNYRRTNGDLGGSPTTPFYILNADGEWRWWRRLGRLLSVGLTVGCAYALYQLLGQRLLGGAGGTLSPRIHRVYQSDDADNNEDVADNVAADPAKAKADPKLAKRTLFRDVHGCDEAKQELQDVVDFLRDPTKFGRLGARLPRGVLLYGPPGTGKTMLARAVAGEAGVPFLYASASEFDQMIVGLGSLRIREMFDEARRRAPSIVFIDELDAVGSRRMALDPQHSRLSLNQLLVELDGFEGDMAATAGVVVIAATNMPDSLDRALLRPGRFDRHIAVPLPDMRGRRSILQHYLFGPFSPLTSSSSTSLLASSLSSSTSLSPSSSLLSSSPSSSLLSSSPSSSTSPSPSNSAPCPLVNVREADVDVLARGTPGFSGADLSKLVNQARMQAARDGSPQLTMHHLELARDDLILGSQRRLLMTEEDRKLTAVHESGHALVAHLRRPLAHPIHKATIVPRGQSLGMVAQLPDRDEVSATRAQLLAKLDVLMGGRVAEELVYGSDNVTTGAGSDFFQATRLARAMVTQYGMSERLGFAVVPDVDDPSPGNGNAMGTRGRSEYPVSESLRQLVDDEVRSLLDAARQRTTALLTQHLVRLRSLAAELLRRETMTRGEIEAVIDA
jgi:ATP-dependent metalloprotease